MDRLLARLERGFLGKLAIERFTNFLVGVMFVVFVMGKLKPELLPWLTLDPALALHQPWRFVTFLFIPPDRSMFFIIFSLLWIQFMGSSLEANWGAFKYNVYYFVGAVGTIAAAYLSGQPRGNFFLNESLTWAVATIAPEYEVSLLFIPVPIRLKWFGLITGGFAVCQFVTGDNGTRLAIAVSCVNYLLFFGPHLVALARGKRLVVQQAARRAASVPPPKETSGRACAICGARQDDGADIRVCSCEKCGGPRELCLEHARNH